MDCPTLELEFKEQLREYIQYLASDDLRGRYPGTEGERMAAEYIAKEFQAAGIRPGAEGDQYYQEFSIYDGVEYLEDNEMEVKGKALSIGEGYYATVYSANGEYEGKSVAVGFGIQAAEHQHDDYAGVDIKGKAVVIDVSSPDGIHPHSKFLDYHDLGKRIDKAVEMGAAAVILIDPSESGAPAKDFKLRRSKKIPVVFVKEAKAVRKLQKNSKVEIEVNLRDVELNARNVIGYLDKGAEYTVVIGAHYDHLGMGGEGSLYRGEPAVHNGADDNASGVAGLIALARTLSKYPEMGGLGARNYLFVAFSGEEKGLLGSNFFVKSKAIQREFVDYMINMDMIGHLNDDGVLVVNGTGTSPIFKEVIRETPCVEVRINATEGGIGPSDHTSFYNVKIPAIHFFTGAHEHYHKPSDDEVIINYSGLQSVLNYILYVIQTVNQEERLKFTPTTEANESKAPRFSVTLGVVPDYAYAGEGMRIDGVSEGKPAALAGLQKGDIVLGLGEYRVSDMMSYMEALGAFKKGDRTEATILRDGATMGVEIQF